MKEVIEESCIDKIKKFRDDINHEMKTDLERGRWPEYCKFLEFTPKINYRAQPKDTIVFFIDIPSTQNGPEEWTDETLKRYIFDNMKENVHQLECYKNKKIDKNHVVTCIKFEHIECLCSFGKDAYRLFFRINF